MHKLGLAVIFCVVQLVLSAMPAAAQERWLSVPFAAFTPKDYHPETSDFRLAPDHAYFETGGAVMFAAVPLRHNSRVRAFQCDVGDYSGSSTIHVEMQRANNGTISATLVMASIESPPGSAGRTILEASGISSAAVRPETFNYRIRARFVPECGKECKIYGCYIGIDGGD